MRASNLSVIGALVAVALTACGGGGGSSSPVATNPTTPTVPTTPVSTVQAADLQVAATSTYAAGSYSETAFNQLNSFRTVQGLGPLNQNANIDIAAKNHQDYVRVNVGGTDPHGETAGKPGFTGVTPKDRMITAGYPAVVASEVIAFSVQYPDPNASAITNLINGLYHRAGMMTQGLTSVGMAAEDTDNPLYVDMGYTKAQINAGDYVGVYPVNGQTGVWLIHSVESPNPFYQEMEMSLANMCAKTSSPVSIASEASTTLNVTSFTITEAGQSTPLDVRLITKATSTQDNTYLTSNVAFVIAKTPFKANTTYNVRFVGKATGTATGSTSGLAIDKSWTFTTGSYKRGC
jgi:uncharacterized protein YkwD